MFRSLVLVLALALGLLVAPSSASATTSAESRFVAKVNASRANRGLPSLAVNTKLAGVARGWSGWMASHDELKHRPGLGTEVSNTVTDDWTRVGENVGYTTNASKASETSLVDRLHSAFMDSTGHKANILGAYNQVGVGVVVEADGTMWVTVNFIQAPVSAGAGVQSAPVVPAPALGGWDQQRAAGSVSAPAAVAWSQERTDLFAIDGNGSLRQRYSVAPGSWAPGGLWGNLGRPASVRLAGSPAVVSDGEGSLDVFARGSDNAVWHRWYRRGSGWSAWTSRRGVITHSPAAASWEEGHVGVFVRSPNGRVYQGTVEDGHWSGWDAITTPVTSAPSVAAWAPGRYDLFARGTDGRLWHAWFSGGRWSSWENLGGILGGGGRPDAVAWAQGRLDVFVVGTTGHVHRKSYQAGFGWTPAFEAYTLSGRNFASGTSALSRQPGHLEVFASDTRGVVWEMGTS